MKNLKKMKGLALVLAGLTLAGLVMTADANDSRCCGHGRQVWKRWSRASDFFDTMGRRGAS